MIDVFVPRVTTIGFAAYATTPVAGSSVNVPSPSIVTTLSASQVVVFGAYKHVAPAPLVCKPVPVARPEPPVIVV